jgi:hypothetical protein
VLLCLDLAGMTRRRLGQANRQYAVQRRFDLLGVDVTGQHHQVLELADAPCVTAQRPGALALLHLGADPQFVVAKLDGDVVAAEARQLGLPIRP